MGRGPASVLLAASVVLMLWRGGQPPQAGMVAADDRFTGSIGEAAVVVAEPGTKLQWSIASDRSVRVTQKQGAVFYRVDRGSVFEVFDPPRAVWP